MKTLIISTVLLFTFLTVYPQSEEIDSLKAVVEGKSADTTRLNATIYLVQKLAKAKDSVSMETYIDGGKQLAQRLNDKKSEIRIQLARGFLYTYQGKQTEAERLYEQLIEESKQTGDSLFLAKIYHLIGNVSYETFQYSKALKYLHTALPICMRLDKQKALSILLAIDGCNWYMREYVKSLEAAEKGFALADSLGELEMKAKFSNTIAIINFTNGNYEKCQDALRKNLEIFEELESYDGLSFTAGNLAGIFNQLGDFEKAKKYFKKSLEYAERGKIEGRIGQNAMSFGWAYLEHDMPDSARYYLVMAKESFKKLNKYPDLIMSDLQAGNILTGKGQLLQAIDYIQAGLKSAEMYNDTSKIAMAYSFLSNIYQSQEVYEKALEYSQKALHLYEYVDSPLNLASAGLIMAQISNDVGQYQKALDYASRSLLIYGEKADSCLMSQAYMLMGSANNHLGKYDSAITLLKLAEVQSKKCKINRQVSRVLLSLGNAYEKEKKQSLAIQAYQEAIEFASPSSQKEVLKDAGLGLHKLYKEQGRYKDALAAFELYHANFDSLFNEKNAKQLAQKEMAYVYEKEKQQQALALEQERAEQDQKLLKQRWLIYTFVGAFALMLLLAIAVYRNYRNKQKANVLLSEQNDAIEQQRLKLQELDESKSRFFANISHELRTPLTLIAGPLEALLIKPENVNETIEMVLRNTRKLKGLVNDILDLSKLESFKMKLNKQSVNIRTFAGRISSNYDSMAKKLEIDYKIFIAPELPEFVLLDASRVEKILNNLLFNAIKYTKAAGSIELLVQTDEESIVFQVNDTGQGIPAVDLPHIFERYYQSKQPDAPIQGGTGIGLALAHELAVLMHGELDVESEAGKGSSFTCKLPLEIAECIPAVTGSDNNPFVDESETEFAKMPSRQLNLQKILYVEDNIDMQKYVQNLLSDTYEVILVGNGKLALQTLEKEKIDLVITDAMMPEMDGFELIERLKASDTFRGLPVIMLTALNFEDSKLSALALGVDDYLSKPFSSSELLARIQNLIARYETRKQIEAELLNESEQEDSDLSGEESPQVLKADAEWLKEVEKIIWDEIENVDLNITNLSDQFHLSRRQFHRRIKKLTGLSPKQYQQDIALQKARKYLEEGTYSNVTAVAYAISISNVSRFSQMYFQRFGKKPGDYFKLGIEV